MTNWLGYFFVVLGAFTFGTSSIVIKYTYSTGLEPLPTLIIQNSLAAAIAWLWVVTTRAKAYVPPSLRVRMVAQGAIGSFLTSVLFYTALDLLGAALATLLIFTYPAFVAAYNVFCRHLRLTGGQMLALGMALVGLVFSVDLLHTKWRAENLWAIMLALGSAVSNAFLTINGERLLVKIDTVVVTAWSFTFSTLMLLIVYQPLWVFSISMTWQQMVLTTAGALLMVLPVAIYMAGLRRIGAGTASIISTAEIPITLVLAWLILSESMNGWQIIGGLLITLSVVMLYYHSDEC